MDDFDKSGNKNIFFKFKSIDNELASRSSCILNECHKLAKYSFQFLFTENPKDLKQFVEKFVCKYHLKHFELVKTFIVKAEIDEIEDQSN